MAFIRFLKEYWVLIAAVLTFSGAWGAQQVKIQTLEQAVIHQQQQQQNYEEIKAKQQVIEERTKRMLESQQTTQRLLESIIQKQNSGR